MPEALQEPFTLTKGDGNVTSTNGPGVAGVWGTIWSYLVPVGIGHIILPGHTLAINGESTAANMPNTSQIRVLVQDASQQDRKAILGPILYASLQNFTDRDQMARFNVPEPVKVYERQYIIIEWMGIEAGANPLLQTAGGGTYGESFFELAMSRVRQPL